MKSAMAQSARVLSGEAGRASVQHGSPNERRIAVLCDRENRGLPALVCSRFLRTNEQPSAAIEAVHDELCAVGVKKAKKGDRGRSGGMQRSNQRLAMS